MEELIQDRDAESDRYPQRKKLPQTIRFKMNALLKHIRSTHDGSIEGAREHPLSLRPSLLEGDSK
jgi:hypothetical protein